MLKKVVILARHGERAPFSDFPSLQWKLCPFTHLTERGKQNAILKGKELKKNYFNFCNQSNQILAHSSNFHRTIETAYYILAEYLSTDIGASIDEHIKFLKLHGWIQRNMKYDAVFRGYTSEVSPTSNKIICEIRKKENKNLKEIYSSVLMPTLFNHQLDLLKITGYQMYCFIDHLRCLRDNGIPLPYKEDNQILKLNESYGCRIYKMKLCELMIRKLCNHSLFSMIIEFLLYSDKKMLLVGLHDYNIESLLVSLGFLPSKDPNYLATIRIELYDNGDAIVYYDDSGVSQQITVKSQAIVKCDLLISELRKEMFKSDAEMIIESGNDAMKEHPELLNSTCTYVQEEKF